MRYRRLGKTGIALSEVGLGTWELSGNAWGQKDRAECIRAIHAAIEKGVNYLDTALEYGDGYSESVIGEAIKQADTSVIISTKVPPQSMEWAPAPHKSINESFSKDWIIECCHRSLKNLQKDCIDILFLHTWSVAWSHATEWHEAMLQLRQQGKIRAIGISVSDRRSSEANVHIEAQRVDVVQVVYNMFEQEPEYSLFPLARKHGVGIVARCPFSSGALIGNWTINTIFEHEDWRSIWTPANWVQKQVEMTRLVRTVIGNCKSLPEAALKFVLSNAAVTSVLPGSSNPLHVRQNASVSESCELSAEILLQLKQLWKDGKVHGVYNGG